METYCKAEEQARRDRVCNVDAEICTHTARDLMCVSPLVVTVDHGVDIADYHCDSGDYYNELWTRLPVVVLLTCTVCIVHAQIHILPNNQFQFG